MKKSCHPTGKALGLLAMRLILGAIFIYAGLAKVIWYREMSAGMFAAMGLPGGGAFWNMLVGSLEILGGAMFVLGVWARYAATWLTVIMLVAVWTMRSNPMGISGMFSPLAVLAGCLGILGTGAGRWRLVKTECHCKDCKMMQDSCSGGCGGNACGCDKETTHQETKAMPMAAQDDGCCGGGCCSSGMEEKK